MLVALLAITTSFCSADGGDYGTSGNNNIGPIQQQQLQHDVSSDDGISSKAKKIQIVYIKVPLAKLKTSQSGDTSYGQQNNGNQQQSSDSYNTGLTASSVAPQQAVSSPVINHQAASNLGSYQQAASIPNVEHTSASVAANNNQNGATKGGGYNGDAGNNEHQLQQVTNYNGISAGNSLAGQSQSSYDSGNYYIILTLTLL